MIRSPYSRVGRIVTFAATILFLVTGCQTYLQSGPTTPSVQASVDTPSAPPTTHASPATQTPAVMVATPTVTPVPATASPTAGSATITQFALASYKRIDRQSDSKAGDPVYVTDQEIAIQAQGTGLKRLDVFMARGPMDPMVSASGVPDANGQITVRLRLPERGVVYQVQGTGVIANRRPPGCPTNPQNECIVTVPGFRIRAA